MLALCLAASLAIQWRAGAWEAEFAAHPDESTHLVSALMVYEYIRQLAPEPPLAFAERYYAHYPKVGIGHWPPGFHTMLAVWMLLTGPGRIRVLLFMAILAAVTSAWLYRLARRELGSASAGGAAALFLALPLTQDAVIGTMTELPLAFWSIAAVAAYIAYLDRPGWTPSTLFGLCASAALLTKGAGIGLALIPPIAVLAMRRFDLLRRADFWAPAAMVLLLAGPWYIAAGRFVPSAMGGTIHRVFGLRHVAAPFEKITFWPLLLGPAFAAAALAGLWLLLLAPGWKGRATSTAAAAGGFVIGVAFFNFALPESGEPRHIHQAAPLAVLLAAGALAAAARRLGGKPAAHIGVWGLATLAFFAVGFKAIDKPRSGFRDAAQLILKDPALRNAAVLVSSERFGEGAFVAEIALARPDPELFVLRGSKALSAMTWSGYSYRSRVETVGEVTDFLDDIPVAAVVIDGAEPIRGAWLHHRLLREAVAESPTEWRLAREIAVPPSSSDGEPTTVAVYRSTKPDVSIRKPIRVDMTHSLKKVIEIEPSAESAR